MENEIGGRWLTDDRGAAEVPEEAWRFGARLRLGLPVLPWLREEADQVRCGLCDADGKECNHALDIRGARHLLRTR